MLIKTDFTWYRVWNSCKWLLDICPKATQFWEHYSRQFEIELYLFPALKLTFQFVSSYYPEWRSLLNHNGHLVQLSVFAFRQTQRFSLKVLCTKFRAHLLLHHGSQHCDAKSTNNGDSAYRAQSVNLLWNQRTGAMLLWWWCVPAQRYWL